MGWCRGGPLCRKVILISLKADRGDPLIVSGSASSNEGGTL